MAGRFFTAAMLFAAAFASDSSATSDNSTASTFSYSAPADEVANTPATDEYGMHLAFPSCVASTLFDQGQYDNDDVDQDC
jgi:hypothetical protein